MGKLEDQSSYSCNDRVKLPKMNKQKEKDK